MKNTKQLLFFIFLLLLIACQSKKQEGLSDEAIHSESTMVSDQVQHENDEQSTVTPPPPPLNSSVKFTAPVITDEPIEEEGSMQPQMEATTKQGNAIEKKIIKDGSISIKTMDIGLCKKHVETLVKQLGGYLDAEYLQNDDQQISYDLKVRVPASRFEKLLAALETGKDEVTSKNIQARDVTEEYVDIFSRLENKKLYLKKYKELLAKASNVRDILAIEEQIRNLQEEIESKEGRLKYLDDQVSFSTLDIHLFKEKEYVYKPKLQDKFGERVKDAFSAGWRGIVGFVLMIFALWPFILLIVGLVYAIKWRRRRVRKNQ